MWLKIKTSINAGWGFWDEARQNVVCVSGEGGT
jgi:hypothetical protein